MEKKEFDKFAEEYDKLHQKNIKLYGEYPEFFHEYKIKDLKIIAKKEKLPENSQILDFGCGIGNSIGIMKTYFPNSTIYGVDISEKSITLAQKRFGQFAKLQSYDGITLPYADSQFDIIFAACVFHHIPQINYPTIFQEIKRILKPNGILVIFEHNPLNPLTVHAVNTCQFDENAVLISCSHLKKILITTAFTQVYSAYRIFFPHFLAKLRAVEVFLKWFPLGAQYYVVSKK